MVDENDLKKEIEWKWKKERKKERWILSTFERRRNEKNKLKNGKKKKQTNFMCCNTEADTISS